MALAAVALTHDPLHMVPVMVCAPSALPAGSESVALTLQLGSKVPVTTWLPSISMTTLPGQDGVTVYWTWNVSPDRP